MKKVYIETLGCSKNQIDSEKMSYLLAESGFDLTDDSSYANIIIINTCSFIQKAKEEAIDTILNLSQLKKSGSCEKIIVAGCLAQYYSKMLIEEIPEIDVVFGVGDISQIINAVKENEKIIIPEFSKDKLIKRNIIGYPGSAYLRISDGCSNFCSYCAIPLIRGTIRSREIESVLEELNFLKTKSIKEIIIIAQDTTNYGIDLYNKRRISDLIIEIDKNLDNNEWLRVLYMHPDHFDDQLISTLKNTKHFIPYFDIPFQSGSDKILKLMGRKGTSEIYLNLIKKLRDNFPDAVFRSSFITGFPTETEDDFKKTLQFIDTAQIEWIGGFTYSEEEGTEASKLDGQINQKIKDKRLKQLLDLSEKKSENLLKRFVGNCENILIEEKVENEEDLFIGRFWGQAPDVDGLTVINCENAKEGEFSKVEIKRLNGKDFYGIG